MARNRPRTRPSAGVGLAVFALLAAVGGGYAALLGVRLALAPVLPWRHLVPFLVYAVGLAVIPVTLRVVRSRADPALWLAAMLLAGVGLLAQFRLGRYNPDAALGLYPYALPIGLAGMLLAAAGLAGGRLRRLEGASGWAGLAAGLWLLAIVVTGRRFRGALFLPGHMNPAEFAKLFLCVFLAAQLARHRAAWSRAAWGVPLPPPSAWLPLAAGWLPAMALLAGQRDLGMILLLNVTLLAVLTGVTGRAGYAVLGLLALAVAVAAVWRFVPHALQRIEIWRDPFAVETGEGWQILQSLSALYSGGFWGSGLGSGFPREVPIVASDFIYAALAEELGFVGCLLVAIAYFILFQRGLRASLAAKDPFSRVLGATAVTLLAAQTLWNIGGVVKALPMTGIPLPFISSGGSSLVTSFCLLGILLAVSDPGGGRSAAPSSRRRKHAKKS